MKKHFAMVLLAIVFMGASVWAYGTTVTVNDNTVGTGTNQFNYHGSWSYSSQSGAYDSDNHWSSTTNDYYTFQFNGQQTVVYGSLAPNGGIAAYSVDGGAERNFDDYAATRVDNVFLFATPILSSGTHTLKVRVTGLKNPSSSGYILPADRIDVNSGLTAVTVNDNTVGTGSSQFNYQGSGWFYGSQSGAYDSDNHWDYTTNDYYTFQFNGTEAIVYGSMAPNGGIAAYSVDGGAETNFDDYAATRVDNVFLFATPIFSSGTHTLKVRVTGLKNPSSSDIVLAADRIDISTTSGGGTVATPTFSPAAGTYTSAQMVTISDSTSGATIHYTTDGSTPTASSTTYTSPITVSTSETVKAIGVETGYTNSAVGSAAYIISPTYPVTDAFSGTGALSSSWTNTTATAETYVAVARASGEAVPSVSGQHSLATYTGVTFTANQYAQTKFVGSATPGGSTGPCVHMSTSGNGYCYLAADGIVYSLTNGTGDHNIGASCPVASNGDTVQLSVSGTTFTCTDVTTGANGSATDTEYSTGNPGMLIDQRQSTIYALSAFQADCVPTCGSGGGGTVATPTFSPAAGTYDTAQTVTISDSTSGATIHYTTDGSTPTASSATYSSPITVSVSETVKAIGVETGYTNSAVGSAAYTLMVATPTFSPGAGTYTSAQTVTISDLSAGATIHYTTDGSTPTASSTTYSAPITVSTSETVKAIGVKSGWTTSVVGSAAYTISSGSGQTWYIRHDGGDNTQCTGTTNAAYPGGTGMHACAYNHPFQMLSWSGAWTAFAPGDTMVFADSPTNTTPYYMGEQNGGVGSDWNPTIGGACPAPNSPHPQGDACALPILPSGVTIKGQNYGNCHTAGHTGLVNPTILSGINSTFAVLQVQGTNNVTISCIEVTQPDNCTGSGGGWGPGQCSGTSNYVDYAGLMLAYLTAQGPANMTLTDFAAVGIATIGIKGSHLNLLSTDTFTASDIYVIGNGFNGWDGDGGGCTTTCESVGTMNLSYVDIEWNGCLALKPYNIGVSPETAPNSFNYCYGESTSGSGDGFVQLAAGNLTLNVSHSMFKYNTQDGFDGAHLSDDPTTSPATTITDSWSEGNAGATFKIGAGASSTAINDVSIANCHVLSQAATFPHNPSGWTTLDYGDTCRAQGDEWSLTLRNGTSITLENNTSLGYGTTMYDLECSYFAPACGSNGGQVVFTNNISKGYPDSGNDGQLAGGWYLGDGLSGANVTADHNLWNTMDPGNTGCPDNTLLGETNYLCSDPLLTGESNIDAINPTPTSSSPVIGTGIHIPGITTDYYGATRPNPPSRGAIE